MSKIQWHEGTEALLDEALTDAYRDDDQIWALRQALEGDAPLPADAFIIGEPISVVEIDYDGKTRRGLTAHCRRKDGSEHVVAVSEIAFAEGSEGPMAKNYTWFVGDRHLRSPQGLLLPEPREARNSSTRLPRDPREQQT